VVAFTLLTLGLTLGQDVSKKLLDVTSRFKAARACIKNLSFIPTHPALVRAVMQKTLNLFYALIKRYVVV
jgi:hypothetical protein